MARIAPTMAAGERSVNLSGAEIGVLAGMKVHTAAGVWFSRQCTVLPTIFRSRHDEKAAPALHRDPARGRHAITKIT